jgi:hypothetical protein
MKDESKKQIRDEISDLIYLEMGFDLIPEFQVDPVAPLDMAQIGTDAKNKAQKLVLACLKLYFDEKIITKNEFMAAKAGVTTQNITTLFKQIRTAEHFIEKIVNEVDNGNMNPRLFEVASGIQSNIIDMLKNTQLHVISMQEEYRRLQSEMPKSELSQNSIDVMNNDGSSSKVYTNAKALLNDLDDEVEEIEED